MTKYTRKDNIADSAHFRLTANLAKDAGAAWRPIVLDALTLGVVAVMWFTAINGCSLDLLK